MAHDNKTNRWRTGQWRYVRPSCSVGVLPESTTGGIAKVKFCRAGEDPLLRDRTPGELYILSQTLDLDMSTLVKMAYPVVKNHWIVNVTVDGSLIDLPNVTEWDTPIVLDSLSSRPPFVVQHGFSQYHVLDNLDRAWMDRYQTYTTFKCANTSWQPCVDAVAKNRKNRKLR